MGSCLNFEAKRMLISARSIVQFKSERDGNVRNNTYCDSSIVQVLVLRAFEEDLTIE